MAKKKSTKKSGQKKVEIVRNIAGPKKTVITQRVREVDIEEPEIKAVEPVEAESRVRTWNIVLSVVYLVQAVALVILAHAISVGVTANYLATDPLQTAAQGSNVMVSANHHLFDISLTAVLTALLLVSAATHLWVATKGREKHEAGLVEGHTSAGWISGTITTSLIMLTIGLLVGARDIGILLILVALSITANLAELWFEKREAGLKPMVLAKSASVLSWVLLALYLIFGGFFGNRLPGYVYWVFGSMYVLFAAQAASIWMRYKAQNRWADPVFGERVLTAISLVAQTALVWQVFGGLLHP